MKKAEAIEGIVSLTRLEGLLDRHPYDLSGENSSVWHWQKYFFCSHGFF